MGKSVDQDLSSFMSILIMTIGALVIFLVVNTVTIASNPDNISLRSLEIAEKEDGGQGGPTKYSNNSKQPTFVDVRSDRVIIYPSKEEVTLDQLERGNNPLEQLVERIRKNREEEYIIIIARPNGISMFRRIRTMVKSAGIDLGMELFDMDQAVRFSGVTGETVDENEPPPSLPSNASEDAGSEDAPPSEEQAPVAEETKSEE